MDITLADRREMWGAAPPTGGEHRVGDRVWHTTPVAGQPVGWVCVEAGAPGQWEPFGIVGNPLGGPTT